MSSVAGVSSSADTVRDGPAEGKELSQSFLKWRDVAPFRLHSRRRDTANGLLGKDNYNSWVYAGKIHKSGDRLTFRQEGEDEF